MVFNVINVTQCFYKTLIKRSIHKGYRDCLFPDTKLRENIPQYLIVGYFTRYFS